MDPMIMLPLYLILAVCLCYCVYLMSRQVFKALCSIVLSVGSVMLVLWLLGKIL